ncbi:hypothetical protein AGMMS50268_17020 [Spirochaetia bacterium]|nr:hypothetical protein AGMMS50268_17020 [Spirochaetia bacterium]
MVKCPKCGKEIRYIASQQGQPIPVELDETHLVTESGRLQRGHKEHICPQSGGPETSKEG